MIIFYIFLLFPNIFCEGAKPGILDLFETETQNSKFTLEKHLKTNVDSLLPISLKKTYSKLYVALEKKNYNKSLRLWSPSFQKTFFAKSSTGQALYAFLMFKNGLQVLGLKHLLNEVEPKKVHHIVRNLWKINVDSNQDIWNYFMSPWSKEWTKFFDEKIAFKVGSKKEISIVKDRNYIEYLLGIPIDDKDNNKSHLEWSLVLHLIKVGDMNLATKILAWLIKKTKDSSKKNTIYLTIARLLHKIGEYEASLHYYDKVKGLSYPWLLAREEKSWIYYNRGDYTKALSQSSSFTYPPLQDVLTPSMLLVLSLSQLKNCDYSNLTDSLTYFKEHFSQRQVYLKNLLKKNSFETVKRDLLSSYSSSDELLSFKHLSHRLKDDSSIKNLILFKKFILENNEVSFAGNFKNMRVTYNNFIKKLDKKIDRKIAVFFRKDISKINQVLKQMYLIEIEALYRIHGYHINQQFLSNVVFEKTISNLKKKQVRVVTFPFDGREIWGDEIGSYRASFSKLCPKRSYIL